MPRLTFSTSSLLLLLGGGGGLWEWAAPATTVQAFINPFASRTPLSATPQRIRQSETVHPRYD
ncbi:Hypothetical protein NocV09_12500010, partial [Nannochloropsis oceanica]